MDIQIHGLLDPPYHALYVLFSGIFSFCAITEENKLLHLPPAAFPCLSARVFYSQTDLCAAFNVVCQVNRRP